MALLRPTRLLISEKSATYTIKWSYTIIWQVRVEVPILSFRSIFSLRKHVQVPIFHNQNLKTMHLTLTSPHFKVQYLFLPLLM